MAWSASCDAFWARPDSRSASSAHFWASCAFSSMSSTIFSDMPWLRSGRGSLARYLRRRPSPRRRRGVAASTPPRRLVAARAPPRRRRRVVSSPPERRRVSSPPPRLVAAASRRHRVSSPPRLVAAAASPRPSTPPRPASRDPRRRRVVAAARGRPLPALEEGGRWSRGPVRRTRLGPASVLGRRSARAPPRPPPRATARRRGSPRRRAYGETGLQFRHDEPSAASPARARAFGISFAARARRMGPRVRRRGSAARARARWGVGAFG